MLHPLAQDSLYRLTRDFDRDTLLKFFVAFHRRIRELDDLARRETRRPAAQDDIDRLDFPLVVGNVTLRRPSCGAMQWLRECAARWWGQSRRTYGIALAYACAHREQEAYDVLQSRWRAARVCWWWACKVKASEEALRRAAIALMPPPDGSLKWFSKPEEQAQDGDRDTPDVGAIAALLAKEYGGTAEGWLWEKADEDFWAAWCGLLDRREAENDPRHDSPESWWRRHRRALAACETALESSVKEWLALRTSKAETAPETNLEAANG